LSFTAAWHFEGYLTPSVVSAKRSNCFLDNGLVKKSDFDIFTGPAVFLPDQKIVFHCENNQKLCIPLWRRHVLGLEVTGNLARKGGVVSKTLFRSRISYDERQLV
jgi:hypothetical protein